MRSLDFRDATVQSPQNLVGTGLNDMIRYKTAFAVVEQLQVELEPESWPAEDDPVIIGSRPLLHVGPRELHAAFSMADWECLGQRPSR